MIRDKKIEVRVNINEYNNVKNICNNLNISISDFFRMCINGTFAGVDKRKIAAHVFNIQTGLNKIYQIGAIPEVISFVEKEVNELWLCLN